LEIETVKAVRIEDPIPHRFLTESDARLFQDSGYTRSDLIVPPFEKKDGAVRYSKRWIDARFELSLVGFVQDGESIPHGFEPYEFSL
jgi:hypothetical protein